MGGLEQSHVFIDGGPLFGWSPTFGHPDRRVVERFEYEGRSYRIIMHSTNGAYPTGSVKHTLQVHDGRVLGFFRRYVTVTDEMVASGAIPRVAVDIAFGK